MNVSNFIAKISGSGPLSDPQKEQVIQNLLREIWGFAKPKAVPKAKAASCFYHYESLLSNRQLLDDNNTSLRDSDRQSSDVIELVKLLRENPNTKIADIHSSLRSNPPHWLINQNHDTLDGVLHFGIRLWLFTTPDLSNDSSTLQEAVQKPLIRGNKANSWLWLDFCAKTLNERGHFHITYTSDIYEHLTFASKSVIRVFSHASVMERYENTSDGKLYPPGLLAEIRRTLNLLWPIEDGATAKHVQFVEKREEVDIEAGMHNIDKFDLRLYPFFGERLAKLQERLEFEEQRRFDSTGIQIAIWGIVLSAIFGLVSAITGIMQVWASFKAL